MAELKEVHNPKKDIHLTIIPPRIIPWGRVLLIFNSVIYLKISIIYVHFLIKNNLIN